MRGFSQHLAWDLAYGSSQAMPTGSSMTGLRGQEKTGGQAGLMSLGPQESWHPTLHRGVLGSALGFCIIHKADLAFFLEVRPHPRLGVQEMEAWRSTRSQDWVPFLEM